MNTLTKDKKKKPVIAIAREMTDLGNGIMSLKRTAPPALTSGGMNPMQRRNATRSLKR